MFDHIGLHVKDIGASVRFYTALLAPLGHVVGSADDSGAGFGPPDAPALWLYAAASRTSQACTWRSAPRPASGRSLLCCGDQSRRPRQRRARPASRLQPHLLRRLSARSRRQQCRGRLRELTGSDGRTTTTFLTALRGDRPAAGRADKMALYSWLIGAWALDVIEFRDDGPQRRRPRRVAFRLGVGRAADPGRPDRSTAWPARPRRRGCAGILRHHAAHLRFAQRRLAYSIHRRCRRC